MPRVIEVVVNSSSGIGATEEMKQMLRNEFANYDLEVRFHFGKNGNEVLKMANDAAKTDADTIAAAGGDGTISGVATEAYRGGKKLGVIPMGTLNNFSKDLGIPQSVPEAIRVIAEGETTRIDIACANGRYFLNNSSIGLYPRIVKKR
ncbi:MAG: diacylglycerol/lipid kinase family protein, partial [Pyrinomonadaceae bacterium]